MKIYLPYTNGIDTLNPQDNLDELVAYSFSRFTEGTSNDFTFADKLLYIDNLRKVWLHRIRDREDEIVTDLIKESIEYNLDEFGNLPHEEDFWDLEFMAECVKAGEAGFYFKFEENHRDTDQTQKCILRIIQIVVNWEDKDEA